MPAAFFAGMTLPLITHLLLKRGQSEAIGRNLFEMAQIKSPIIVTIIGIILSILIITGIIIIFFVLFLFFLVFIIYRGLIIFSIFTLFNDRGFYIYNICF